MVWAKIVQAHLLLDYDLRLLIEIFLQSEPLPTELHGPISFLKWIAFYKPTINSQALLFFNTWPDQS